MPTTIKNIYACNPQTERGNPTAIWTHEKNKLITYCTGPNVVIRSVEDPLVCELYQEHLQLPTVAKLSPSGFYMASGDAGGTLKVWSYDNPDKIVKYEGRVIGGKILDLDWDFESKRVVVCGEAGQPPFIKALLWDTGNTVGDMGMHNKRVISCSFKPSRPMRAISSSDDLSVNFYEGPPFKFKSQCRDHTRYPNCVRFSPSGDVYVSVGADMKAIVFDGKTGEKTTELVSEKNLAHGGSIYQCAFSPDSKQMLTVSADKTAKLWEMESGSCVQTFTFAEKPTAMDMQVGCAWVGDVMMSLNLAGDLHRLSVDSPSEHKPIFGHNKNVTAVATDGEGMIYSGDSEGKLCVWREGVGSVGKALGHSNMVVGMVVAGGMVVSAGTDDTIIFTDAASGAPVDKVAAEGAPVAIGGGNTTVVVLTRSEKLMVFESGKVVATLPADNASSVAISSDGTTVALGLQSGEIKISKLSGGALTAVGSLKRHQSKLNAMAFSADGSMLGSVCNAKDVVVWDVATLEPKVTGWSGFHTASPTCIAWSPAGDMLATGGVDANLFIWKIADKSKEKIMMAHKGGVASCTWLTGTMLATGGLDCVVKTWNVA